MEIAPAVYMVMEWVDGRLLRQMMCEQKKLPPERAVRITTGYSAKRSIHPLATAWFIAT